MNTATPNYFAPLNIIDLLDIGLLPYEQRAEIVDEASGLILDRIFNKIVGSLSEEDRERFMSAVLKRDMESVSDLLHERGFVLNEMIEEEAASLKAEYAAILEEESETL